MTALLVKLSSLLKNIWCYCALSILTFLLCNLPQYALAHQNPSTIVLLDISSKNVAMELQILLSELELAYGHNISVNPEKEVPRQERQLIQYLLSHIHLSSANGQQWSVAVTNMKVEKAVQAASGPPFQEITAYLNLTPPSGSDVRNFTLNYDVIMHQVVTHSALVSVRTDWETGNTGQQVQEVGSIRVDTRSAQILPMHINLKGGSWFTGFKSMVGLGMQHIKEGTDHLLFLLVLLLPATLLVNGQRWGGFGGTRYSIMKLLKTTTAFTIGHSLTLLIGAFKLVQLPPQPIEVLIAISILVSAIHAIVPIFAGKEMYIAGGFGLVHGLAFASILSNLNLGAGPMAWSILGFNIGIELMQLFVILLVIPWIMLLSGTPSYKPVRVSAAVLAGVAAIAWIAERITGAENAFSHLLLQGSKYGYVSIFILAVITIYALISKKSLNPEKLSS